AGDVVKEPTARRDGAQHPSLHFDEPRGVLIARYGPGASCGLEKRARSSRQIAALAVVDPVHFVREPLHREAQRGAPILLRRPVGVDFATASRAPPLDAVGAAPGRWLHQVYRRRGWVGGQRGREVRDLGLAGPLQAMDDGGECLIGAFVMVSEGLAIVRDAG